MSLPGTLCCVPLKVSLLSQRLPLTATCTVYVHDVVVYINVMRGTWHPLPVGMVITTLLVHAGMGERRGEKMGVTIERTINRSHDCVGYREQ